MRSGILGAGRPAMAGAKVYRRRKNRTKGIVGRLGGLQADDDHSETTVRGRGTTTAGSEPWAATDALAEVEILLCRLDWLPQCLRARVGQAGYW